MEYYEQVVEVAIVVIGGIPKRHVGNRRLVGKSSSNSVLFYLFKMLEWADTYFNSFIYFADIPCASTI